MKTKFVEFPFLPITQDTFERQGWEKVTEEDGGSEEEQLTHYFP